MKLKQVIRKVIVSIPKNKNKIIFESHSDFTDSSRTIYEALKEYKQYKFIWFVDHPENFHKTNNTIFLNINKKRSIRNIYHILTSKYIFFTHRAFPLQNYKKQYVVNLTHGLGMKDSHGKMVTDFNYVLNGSEHFSDISCYNFRCSKDKLVNLGLPRNDLLFEKDKKVESLVAGYDKLILWLPTFRQHKNGVIDVAYQDNQTFPLFLDSELQELNDKLKEYNYLLILKLHPAQKITNHEVTQFSNIKIMVNEDLEKLGIQFYHLIGKADTLLTDYSSVGNDYLLLDRPIGYVIDDVEEYRNSRGFNVENVEDYLPGDKIMNKKDFYQYLEKIKAGNDTFKEDRKRVCDFYWKYQDNKNTERLLEYFGIKEG